MIAHDGLPQTGHGKDSAPGHAPAMDRNGRLIALTPQRRLIADLMWACRGVPLVTFQRRMNLAALRQARAGLTRPPSWTVLLVRGFAMLAAERPELRRLYVPFPRPRIYEHRECVVRVAVERVVAGETAVLFGRLVGPEHLELATIADRLDHFANAPLDQVRSFQRLLRVSALPLPIRRAVWLAALNSSPVRRARLLGTFSVSTTGSMGAWAVHLRSPSAVTLHCGPIETDGAVDMYLTFDHRVLDGAPVARVLADFEDVLNGRICAEVARA
jgi:hypothetical protein